ncbi:MAG: metallophosphoesterase family protein, partial [Bacteroidota bacterium]
IQQEGFEPYFLVVSGDLGYKGSDHERGSQFVSAVARLLKIPCRRIVCCPGNHDIQLTQKEQPFQNYMKAAFGVLEESTRVSVSPVTCYQCEGVNLFIINSCYHLDHRYGKIHAEELRKKIKEGDSSGPRIAVVHHHSIPVFDGDTSAIVNAYEFLSILVDSGFDLVLHGHHHIALSLTVGNRTKLVGVGSVNYPPERNLNNQFNILEFGVRVCRFRYVADASGRGILGAWKSEVTPW